MNAILYITIFIIGTLFGSFYTLAVYRIPRSIDILVTHSFCPNCKHKLGFLELIPVWSYIFLGGKCKKCKQKIRPRYFILEILSGFTYVLIAVALKISVNNLNLNLLIAILFMSLYLVAIFLIAGIDKEYIKIEKSVLYYALVISLSYIIYLCIIDFASIYRYVMYLGLLIILILADTYILKKKAKNSYLISILILMFIMTTFTGRIITAYSILVSVMGIILAMLLYKVKNDLNKTKKVENIEKINLPIGTLMCIANVLILILSLFINNWYM